ncbi:MAG: NAD(P)-dependent oxidoreductase [Candidatus Altiarchaeota archaeon]
MTGNILVTGYSGFIGANLCKRLVEGGYAVVGADIKRAGLAGVEHHSVDVSDFRSFRSLPLDIDCVVHLAGISFIPEAEEDLLKTYDINVIGTYNTLKFHTKCENANYIFASSSKVYGEPKYLPVDEKHPTNPTNSYGRSKKAAEDLIRVFHEERGGFFIILRQFNIYGPGQAGDFFIPTLLNQLSEGNKLKLGNITVKRDFLYVDDLVDAYMILIEKRVRGLNIFNVGGGKSMQLGDVVKTAAGLYGRRPEVNLDSAKLRKESKDIRSDNTKLCALGWKPKTSMAEGLGRIKEAGG